MKKSILSIVAILAFSLITFLACKKQAKSNDHKKSQTMMPFSGTVNSFDTISDEDKVTLNNDFKIIFNTSDFIIKRIATSDLTDAEIDSLSNETIDNYNLFSTSEIDSIQQLFVSASTSIRSILNSSDTCSTCSLYTEAYKWEKMQDQVRLYRNDPHAYTTMNAVFFQRANLFDTDPGCSFAFYVCVAACTTAGSPLAAGACVYLCACSFCDYTPPGC